MVIIPGLSRPLEAVGKHVVSWDDSDDRLAVEVGGVVAWATCPDMHLRQFPYPWPLGPVTK